MNHSIKPRASSSTPFFKSKSSTIAPTPSKHKNTVHGKQRKRSLTNYEISPNIASNADIPEPLDKTRLGSFKTFNIPKKKGQSSLSKGTNSGSYNTIEIDCNTSNQVSDTSLDSCSRLNAHIERSLISLAHQTRESSKNVLYESARDSTSSRLSIQPSISAHILSSSKSLYKKNSVMGDTRKRSLLQRSQSRKWTINEQRCKIDPTAFLANPASLHCVDQKDQKDQRFILMHRLLISMTLGGYITHHLHVPMELWYQQNVHLHYVEAKTSASELAIAVLEKMEARNSIDLHLSAVMSELKVFKQTLNQINDTLMKKLGCPIPVSTNEKSSPRQSTNRTSQTIVIWSTKLTKSVEKMRFDATRNTAPNDEQHRLYIMTLIRLFTKAKTLENWNKKLELVINKNEPLAKQVYERLSACIFQFMSIFCGFVLKDYSILLNKWFKQSMLWVTE